jgi:hypothetical protein
MSKKIRLKIPCPFCKHEFEATLFRTLWIEYPENRQLIFQNNVNVVICPRCKRETQVNLPFLATNVKEHIAVWYEPFPDPQIDIDQAQYAKHMGKDSFYATAPRVRDWTAFKEKIVELEQRTGMKPGPKFSFEMDSKMRGFIDNIRRQQNAKTGPSTRGFTKDSIVFHAKTGLFCPAVLWLVGESVWRITESRLMAWLSGIGVIFFSWRIIGRGINWISSGANIPVAEKDQRGIERLGFVFGLIAVPISAITWYRYAEDNSISAEPAVLLLLPVTICAFLLAKILVRISFWIRDGFNNAP